MFHYFQYYLWIFGVWRGASCSRLFAFMSGEYCKIVATWFLDLLNLQDGEEITSKSKQLLYWYILFFFNQRSLCMENVC